MSGAAQHRLLAALGVDSYSFAYDPQADTVRLIRLTLDEIARAAFLDQRVLTEQMPSEQVSFAAFEAAARALPGPPPNLIFHMGHCGSTLLSKLLAAAGGAHSFREPLPLRSLAAEWADTATGDSFFTQAEIARRLDAFLKSWSRGRGTTVKASSVCTELLAPFLSRRTGARAVFMYLKPERFLATMLGGEANRNDLAGFAKFRRRRLCAVAPGVPPLPDLSPGEIAALIWLVEAVAAARSLGPALLTLDFDAFLEAPARHLATAAAHLDAPASHAAIAAAVNGPLMQAYSKAPEHAFSSEARRRFLDEYAREHRDEIERGAALIKHFSNAPPVAAAITAFGS